MRDLVERVATAISKSFREQGYIGSVAEAAARAAFIDAAYDAILAMREPTEAIIKAHHVVPDDNDFEERARSNWQAMIDAALQEGR